MADQKSSPQPYTKYHKDGSLWAKGQTVDGVQVGCWEFYRKDGSLMRSGSFDQNGQQIGEWTTYDREGKVYRVTSIKPKSSIP